MQTLALSRLHALVVLLVVSGYTDLSFSGAEDIPHKRAPATARRHDASMYVTKVYEQERKRLSQDLHDEVGHDLVLVKLYLEMMVVDARVSAAAAPAGGGDRAGVACYRQRAPPGPGPGPGDFDDLGFLPAVRTYTGQFSARTKIPVALREGYVPENIPMSHQAALYRLLQGALSNVVQHAEAKPVTVRWGA